MKEERRHNEFMVEWEYTYTYNDHCSCGCDRHQSEETRTTGKQFQTIEDVRKFIKENMFDDEVTFISRGSMKNVRVFKLNKLEVKLDLE